MAKCSSNSASREGSRSGTCWSSVFESFLLESALDMLGNLSINVVATVASAKKLLPTTSFL